MAQLKIKPQWWIDKMNDANKNARDTQFMGYAKALWKELEDHPYVELGQLQDCDRQQLYRVIARRAYDLVDHTFEDPYYAVQGVPDVTELPKDNP
jgi:hypothetical protein